MNDQSSGVGQSATEWRQMYLPAISKLSANEISVSEPEMAALLSMIGLEAFISCGAAIEPHFLINEKGVTPWLAMYLLMQQSDPNDLELVANGKKRIHIPPDIIRAGFCSHVNWPQEMITRYDLTLGKSCVFAIPFLVHQSVKKIGEYSQSMKRPDGSLEVFGVHELIEGKPADLLEQFSELVGFIKETRPDAIQ